MNNDMILVTGFLEHEQMLDIADCVADKLEQLFDSPHRTHIKLDYDAARGVTTVLLTRFRPTRT